VNGKNGNTDFVDFTGLHGLKYPALCLCHFHANTVVKKTF